MSKLISSSWNKNNDNVVYFECECRDELMCISQLHSKEVVIGCITNNGKNKEIIFSEPRDFYIFMSGLRKLCERTRDTESYSHHQKEEPQFSLTLCFDREDNYFCIGVYENIAIEENKCYWEVYLTEDNFEILYQLLEKLFKEFLLSFLPIAQYSKVRILNKEEMNPTSIDKIGRLHFDLGDNTDIVFSEVMAEHCNEIFKVSSITPYVTKEGDVKCTFYISGNAQLWTSLFNLDMVEVL